MVGDAKVGGCLRKERSDSGAEGDFGRQRALRANPAIFNHQKRGIDNNYFAVGEEKKRRQPSISGAIQDGVVQVISGGNDWANLRLDRRRTQQPHGSRLGGGQGDIAMGRAALKEGEIGFIGLLLSTTFLRFRTVRHFPREWLPD
jgi:hypothetical protein